MFEWGDRVVFVGDSYATHALAPAAWLIPVPDGISPSKRPPA